MPAAGWDHLAAGCRFGSFELSCIVLNITWVRAKLFLDSFGLSIAVLFNFSTFSLFLNISKLRLYSSCMEFNKNFYMPLLRATKLTVVSSSYSNAISIR